MNNVTCVVAMGDGDCTDDALEMGGACCSATGTPTGAMTGAVMGIGVGTDV